VSTLIDFKHICVVGLGLMGGSIVKALKDKGYKGRITAWDNNAALLEDTQRLGLIDGVDLSTADLIIMAVPIQEYRNAWNTISDKLSSTCLITDVGSVKTQVHQTMKPLIGEGQRFIGGHPMIGSEKSGFAASKSHLFENAYYFLTQDSEDAETMARIQAFVTFIGANPIQINAKIHDKIVARTSHLPHINAVMMVNLIKQKGDDWIDYVGGGFRDGTRIASGDPELWVEILEANREELIITIEEFILGLQGFKSALETSSSQVIRNQLSMAKAYRGKIPKHLSETLEQECTIFIDVKDEPGVIAQATLLLAQRGLSIKDIEILHARENIPGVLKIGFYHRKDQLEASQWLKSSDFGKINPIYFGGDVGVDYQGLIADE
jgi:prephenate dehydrogenase